MTRKEILEKTIDFDDAIHRIVRLEKEIEILKKRVDYFYEEIRPYIVIDRCKYKHVVSDEKGLGHACYEKQSCLDCEYGTNKIGGIENV